MIEKQMIEWCLASLLLIFERERERERENARARLCVYVCVWRMEERMNRKLNSFYSIVSLLLVV